MSPTPDGFQMVFPAGAGAMVVEVEIFLAV